MALSTRTQIKQKIKKEKRMDFLVGREDTLTAIEGVGYQTATDVNALIAQYLIDNPPTGGSVVKSIQRGSSVITNGLFTIFVTISSVDITKSFIIFSETSDTNSVLNLTRGKIQSSSALNFRREAGTGLNRIEWEVVEYV